MPAPSAYRPRSKGMTPLWGTVRAVVSSRPIGPVGVLGYAGASATVGRVQRAPCALGQALPLVAANPRLRRRDAVPLMQEFLGQMLGVRRTTVTIAARLLQSAGLIYAKANPGKIDVASAGPGSTPHLYAELFKMMAGVDHPPCVVGFGSHRPA